MAHCQVDKLHSPEEEKSVAADEKAIKALTYKSCKSRVDFLAAASVQDMDLQAQRTSGRLQVFQRVRGIGIGRIDENSHASGSRQQLTQKSQPLCRQLGREDI